jgi:hypothetical protein
VLSSGAPLICGLKVAKKIKHQGMPGALITLGILGDIGRKKLYRAVQVHIQRAVLRVPIGVILFGIRVGLPNL